MPSRYCCLNLSVSAGLWIFLDPWYLCLRLNIAPDLKQTSALLYGQGAGYREQMVHFPGKDTGVGCHFLLQGISPTQGSNPSLLPHCIGRQILDLGAHRWEASVTLWYRDGPSAGSSMAPPSADKCYCSLLVVLVPTLTAQVLVPGIPTSPSLPNLGSEKGGWLSFLGSQENYRYPTGQ